LEGAGLLEKNPANFCRKKNGIGIEPKKVHSNFLDLCGISYGFLKLKMQGS